MSDIDPYDVLKGDPDEAPSDAAHHPGGRYERPGMRDLLRRIPDLLIGDVVAYNGEPRTVREARWHPRNPSEALVQFEPRDEDDVDPKTGNPRWYRHMAETRLRVLRSNWTAPQ